MADIVAHNHALIEAPKPARIEAHSTSTNGLWQSFQARRFTAILAGVLMACLTGAVLYFANPARYHVTALVRVKASVENLLSSNANIAESSKSPFQMSQPAVVVSRNVLSSVAKNKDIATFLSNPEYGNDIVAYLEHNLKVVFIEDTDFMQVSLSGSDNVQVAALVNAVVDSYVAIANEADSRQLVSEIEALNKSANTIQETLRRDTETLNGLQKTLGITDPAASKAKELNLVNAHAALSSQVAYAQAEMRALQIKIALNKSIAESKNGLSDPSLVEQRIDADPAIQRQASIVQLREDARNQVRQAGRGGETSPALARAENELSAAQATLQRLRGEAREKAMAFVGQKSKLEAAERLKQLLEEQEIRKDQLTKMETQEREKRDEMEKVGRSSFDMENKRGDIANSQQLLNKLREKIAQLGVEKASTKWQRVSVVQKCDPPEYKNTKAQNTFTILGSIGGLCLGLVGVSYLELRSRRIQSVEQVSGELGINVVGSLPALPARWAEQAGTGDGFWGHLVTESVAYIRTVVLSGKNGPTQTLLVTSAQSQEGKTMLACNLALSIARTGRRTLLIDGDIRRPSVAALFGVKDGPGLSELLRGEVDIADCLSATNMPTLTVLPAGRCCRTVIQSLAQEGIEALFRQLRADFDYIVIDSCPILPVSDALLLGRLSDAVVFCVRPKISRAPSVKAALEMINRLHLPLLGTVINGAAHRANRADYHYVVAEREVDETVSSAS